jgi:hypothetical protein
MTSFLASTIETILQSYFELTIVTPESPTSRMNDSMVANTTESIIQSYIVATEVFRKSQASGLKNLHIFAIKKKMLYKILLYESRVLESTAAVSERDGSL